MKHELVDTQNEQPFISVDFDKAIITLEPKSIDKPGFYSEAYLRFFFDLKPDLYLDFPIESNIHRCTATSVKLSTPAVILTELTIGGDEIELAIPEMIAKPDCAEFTAVTSYNLTVLE